MESVWDHIVKINKCFKLDRKTEYFVTAGAGTTVDNPVEAIANCALDMMDAGHRALMNPATGKPVKISVRNNSMWRILFSSNSSILTYSDRVNLST